MNLNNAIFEISYGKASQLHESTLPEIVFSGRSNVGKSSLINKILNRKSLARVSSSPGKTGTINFYKLDNIRLVDLPGYGYAKVSFTEKKRWAELVQGYLSSNRNIMLLIQLIDMRHPPSKDDMQMLDYLRALDFPFIIVLTKSDKLKPKARASRLKQLEEELSEFKDIHKVPFSSMNAEGVDELRSLLEEISINN